MTASQLIAELINVYMIVLIVRCVMSFIPHNRTHPLVVFLYRVTDPVLQPVRRIIPPIGGTLDISPIIVFLVLSWLRRVFLTM